MNRRIKKKIIKKHGLNYKQYKALNRLVKGIISRANATTTRNYVELINSTFRANKIPYVAYEDPWAWDDDNNFIYLRPTNNEEVI